MSEAMRPMSSLLFPGQTEPFEVVDAEARKGVEQLTEEIANKGNPTNEQVSEAVNAYLAENPVQSTPVDSTLTKEGEAADAAVVGGKLAEKASVKQVGDYLLETKTKSSRSVFFETLGNYPMTVTVDAESETTVTATNKNIINLPPVFEVHDQHNKSVTLFEGAIEPPLFLSGVIENCTDMEKSFLTLFDTTGAVITYITPTKLAKGFSIKKPLGKIDYYNWDKTLYCTVKNIQLEYGDQATAYEQYASVSVTAQPNEPVQIMAFDGINFVYAANGNVTVSGRTLEKKAEENLQPLRYGLPELKLFGSVYGMDKDNAVTLNFEYGDLTGTCTCKWQGSSSIQFDKKNYTIKFDQAFEAKEGWGAQKKYCFKANWVDASHARNVVSAKLWGQIVKSRSIVPVELANLVNGGAVDGFPCIITLNGDFHGLYTWNIPKDGWMLGMGNGANECIVCAEGNGGDGMGNYIEGFKNTVSTWGTGFEYEYATTETDEQKAAHMTSLNNMITAVKDSDGTNVATVETLLDLTSAMDWWSLVMLMQGTDNYVKNYLLHTFDGTKWAFTGYDMDATWGMEWHGKTWHSPQVGTGLASFAGLAANQNSLKFLLDYKRSEFKARYKQLRSGVLSEANVYTTFMNFLSAIPSEVIAAERRKWTGLPSTNVNDINQIMTFYRLRVEKLDAEVDAM